MRQDMTDKFVEPSSGSKIKKFPRKAKALNRSDEDGLLSNKGGMKKPYYLWPKDWGYGGVGTDNSLLRRFLESRVGKVWDDVYSEIRSHADYRSFKGHHLLEWLERTVELHAKFIDGDICDSRGVQLTGRWMGEFYVHPEKGTLEVIKTNRWHPPAPGQKVFEVDKKLYYKDNDIWYRVEMTLVPKVVGGNSWDYSYESVNDVFHSELNPSGDPNNNRYHYYSFREKFNKYYGLSPDGAMWYCSRKESANSKEIDKLKKKYPETFCIEKI